MGPATASPRQAEPAVYVTTCRSAVAPWMPARQRRYAPSSLDKRHLQALRSHVLVIVRQNVLDLSRFDGVIGAARRSDAFGCSGE